MDKFSLNRHNDNTHHSAGENLRSATIAVIIGTLHQICEDCTIPTGHVSWAHAASDTGQLMHVLKLDHFENQRPELAFTVLDEKG